MDGNYHNTYDIRMPRADSLIWLDYPRVTCMGRVLLRVLKDYGRNRPDLPPGARRRSS
jgi:adenylate kinase family enzyme